MVQGRAGLTADSNGHPDPPELLRGFLEELVLGQELGQGAVGAGQGIQGTADWCESPESSSNWGPL